MGVLQSEQKSFKSLQFEQIFDRLYLSDFSAKPVTTLHLSFTTNKNLQKSNKYLIDLIRFVRFLGEADCMRLLSPYRDISLHASPLAKNDNEKTDFLPDDLPCALLLYPALYPDQLPFTGNFFFSTFVSESLYNRRL